MIDRIRPLPATIRGADRVALVTTASLFVVVINNRDTPALFLATAAVAVVGLANPRVARSPWLWLAVGAAMGANQLFSWEGVDDHVILTTYWALAVGFSLLALDPGRMLAWNARILVALVFGFAVFWKVTSGDFTEGDFFRYSLLLDDRFQYIAESLGGLDPREYAANYAAVAHLHANPADTVSLVEPDAIRWLAVLMTGWGLVSEAGAALSHLFPLSPRFRWIRHFWLFAFAATTYAIVPIGGFGLILLLFGLAQTEPGERKRVAYVAVMAAILVYAPLWRALFYS